MSEKKESLLSMVVSLGVITILAAALLAWVNNITDAPKKATEIQRQVEAVQKVVPKFDNNPISDAVMVELDNGELLTLYPAKNNGSLVGVAVESFSNDGFSGEIKVMYGFDREGNIYGYEVLSHAETPGLGAKMQEWFMSEVGNRSVIGKNPQKTSMYVSKDAGGEIDGITAATITSRAFLDALRRANDAYLKYYNAQ